MSGTDSGLERMTLGPTPQNARNSDKPGSYELAIRLNEAEVNPGDMVHLEVFLTGYGVIDGAKIVFYPPPSFFDPTWSSWRYDIGPLPDGSYGFGTTETKFGSDAGVTLIVSPAGIPGDNWPAPSLFFDTTNQPESSAGIHRIATETKAPNAPVEFSLQTRRTIPSGTHRLYFYMTYFNGQEWKTAKQAVDLMVRNFFQRNEALTWTVGILAFIAALADPVITLLN
jgi:hypothetical protein